jgi:hypothetical protein
MKIATGALIAGISSQAKITMAKLENFKFTEQKQIFLIRENMLRFK